MKVVGHLPASRLLESIDSVRDILSLGIGVEVQLSSKILDTFTLREFGILKSRLDGTLTTIHAPFLDLNPGAVDDYVLEATRKRFLETVLVANVLEAEVVVFHTGYHPPKIDPLFEVYFERALETFSLIVKEGDFLIALENVFDRNPKVLKAFLENLPGKVGVCIDTGHLNLFSEVPLSDWLSAFEGRIFEFHLHDNRGDRDSHLPIGWGSFPFDALFSSLGTSLDSYIFNLENKTLPHIRESLKTLKENFFGGTDG